MLVPEALQDAIYVQQTRESDWMLGSPDDDAPVLICATREPLDFVRHCIELANAQAASQGRENEDTA